MLAAIRQLVEDFYSSDAYDTAPDLRSMTDKAEGEFRSRHPDMSDAAVDALAWAYSYDMK